MYDALMYKQMDCAHYLRESCGLDQTIAVPLLMLSRSVLKRSRYISDQELLKLGPAHTGVRLVQKTVRKFLLARLELEEIYQILVY